MERPNVIYVFSDQHRAQACGYAGDVNVRTPNMDRMAAESMDFVHAVSGMPVCCPYRASLLTGRYPHQHGVFLNDVCLADKSVTIAEAFKGAGYDTAYIGKWHLDGHGRSGYIPEERRRGFEYWKVLECTHDYNDSSYYEDGDREIKKWEGYDAFAQTKDAIRLLRERDKQKPLFMMLSWGPPHNPYDTAPERFRRMYEPDSIQFRDNVTFESRYGAAGQLAGYYAHITALDECLGMLADALRELGMEEDTIFIYTSDHGDMLGSQGTFAKQKPWDENILVPFLMRYPRRFGNKGRKVTLSVNTPDIMPTLLGICGIPVPDTVAGANLAGYLDGKEEMEDKGALLQCLHPFGEWHKNVGGREYRGIRTRRYTYVRDLHGPWLLYDNQEDPYQLTNLLERAEESINESERAEIEALKEEMESRLRSRLADTNDGFLKGREYLKEWGYEVDLVGTYPYKW